MSLKQTAVIRSLLLLALLALAGGGAVQAAPVVYEIDPAHTYPSFTADHMGLSVWRGKFNHTTGKVVLDRAAETGSVKIIIDLASVDVGHKEVNRYLIGPKFFKTAEFPQGIYEGKLVDFVDGAPTRVAGTLTLHGITRPVSLRIRSFECVPHPLLKREVCGADVVGTFQRDEFGLDMGKAYGFDMAIKLQIQVEAIAVE